VSNGGERGKFADSNFRYANQLLVFQTMRNIGYLEDEKAAHRFGDFLYVNGMPNNIELDQKQWAIWVHDDDHLDNARVWLEKFRVNPTASEFASAVHAEEKRKIEEKDLARFQKKMQKGRDVVRTVGFYGVGRLTAGLIAISVVVAIISGLDRHTERVMALFMTNWVINGQYVQWAKGLPEIFHGQIWRLFTPMFIHFGIMHILFNMLWLRDLGSMIEARESSLRLLIIVLLTSAGSNLAQYSISIPALPNLGGGSPVFGGMSGVVYGLLGYIWMRAKFDPFSGFFLHKSTVTMMLIWLVACFTGFLGPVANLAHLFGLLIGMGAGFFFSHFRVGKF
jgi:GlpG protein